MVAFGGAGPVHAYEIARLLNVRQVIFPRGAGVASAIGMLVAPRSVEYTRSLIQGVDHLEWDQVSAVITELAERGRAVLREGGLEDRQIALELMADMRYVGQGFEVTVPLDATIPQRRDVTALRQAFERDYVLRFGRDLGGVPVEVVSWRARMIAPPAVREVRFASEGTTSGEALIERRLAYFEETGGFVDTPVYARARLGEGTTISGPALIEEAESTAVVGPSATVEVDHFGNLIMQVRHPTQLNGGSL
jgi:N-methylhydantoinase A